MATSRKRALLFTAVPLLILMMPFSVYFLDSAAASDKVARNVTISGVDVARYGRADAVAAIEAHAAKLTDQTATVTVNGMSFELHPSEVGLVFDTETAVDVALEQNQDGITDWLRAFSEEVDVAMHAHIDPDLLELKLIEWEAQAVENPAFEGSIEIVDGAVELEYPHDGEAIDRAIAVERVTRALEVGSTDPIDLPTATAVPTLTAADLDAAADEAYRIMETPVILTQAEYGFTFRVEPADVSRAFAAQVVRGTPSTVEFSFDRSALFPLVEASRQELELAPQDAYWETVLVDDHEPWDENYEITDSELPDDADLPENDTITLVPARNGTTIDAAAVVDAVERAALGDGSGELPIVLDAPPAFTTEMAAAYGELYEVSEFTTYKPGVNRAHNINLMADLVDNTIVWPGETFSVNEHVGRRTLEKGFKYDCAIVSGELSCEEDAVNVGGGVSQFGTTIFNTIYFGCYEVVTHQPHSIYFSKYPEGREATLGYPSPDVAFMNNSNAPVIIRTSYTKRSITVTFFGNQEGKYCGTERSGRSSVSSPTPEYQADPDGVVRPGEERVKSKGTNGWFVLNTRIFYDAAGNELEREDFPWRYRGERNIILVHPCDVRVGGSGVCPVQVPGVSGMTQAQASEALAAIGLQVNVIMQATDDPTKDGIVLSVAPGGWQEPGTVITIAVGQFTGGGGDGDGGGGGGEGGGGDG
jgi:vancomycin resistance protein YoaR